MKQYPVVSQEEMLRQREYMDLVREMEHRPRSYHIVSMGCQMNARDSESIAGMLEGMGMTLSPVREQADLILYNTCCVFSPYAIVLDGHCVRFGDRLVRRLIDYIHPRLVPANRHKPDILVMSHTVSNAVTGAGIRLREKWIKELN